MKRLVTKLSCHYKTDTVADLVEWLSRFPLHTPILNARVELAETIASPSAGCIMSNHDAVIALYQKAIPEMQAMRQRCLDKGYIVEEGQ
jgi:hypothetical protein